VVSFESRIASPLSDPDRVLAALGAMRCWRYSASASAALSGSGRCSTGFGQGTRSSM